MKLELAHALHAVFVVIVLAAMLLLLAWSLGL
jgi:hypothetical protein